MPSNANKQIAQSLRKRQLNVLACGNGRYKILSQLGEGTYGKVWKSYDNESKCYVALKQLKEFSCPEFGVSVSVIREITIMKSLNHKNLAKLIDFIGTHEWNNESFFLVLELENSDLEKWICRNAGRIQLVHCRDFLIQILEGCNFLHSHNIMHRDIKPDNILINEETGALKLADFGLSRLYAGRVGMPFSSNVQALWYRAPELLLGCNCYSQKIDVWSIG